MTYILGISAYYHDSAAALLREGVVIAAAQEERFTRKKHDPRFPIFAIQYCLQQAGIDLTAIDYIAFYEKPVLKLDRIMKSYLQYAPQGITSFLTAMPQWLGYKLFIKKTIAAELQTFFAIRRSAVPKILFAEHHQSHAASAFFLSPYKSAAVLCLDGVGEWASTSVWQAEGKTLQPSWQINFPHSLGLLYSAFTHYTGFKVNSGEYKLMGLAPYGEPKYRDLIYEYLIDVKEDGTYRLNMQYFDFAVGLQMTTEKFAELFGAPARTADQEITQREMDLARSIQLVTEEVVLKISNTLYEEQQSDSLCMAGGVALNCVANGRILRESKFEDIWIQPASGDAGGALGSALSVWHSYLGKERQPYALSDHYNAYLGPSFSNTDIKSALLDLDAEFVYLEDEVLFAQLATLLDAGNIIGWFQGRMEFGPRALGSRSILADPRNPKIQSVMNLKIKYRESFRPFAPAILREKAGDYFQLEKDSPYMLIVSPVQDNIRIDMSVEQKKLFGIDKLKIPRSTIPAVTHVDYSARVQTVHKETNARFYKLLQKFHQLTSCPVVVNTSFNVRGEPIVCTPEQAYKCFMRTEMDYLVIENYLLKKADQVTHSADTDWQEEFELD